MSMVTCRSCGARNPAGSKFCNHCGASLTPNTKNFCPNCQTPNPNHLLYCDNCGTRLTAEQLPQESDPEEARGKGSQNHTEPFSLPSRPPGEQGALDVTGELPDWLKTGEGGAPEVGADEAVEAALPDWLQGLAGTGSGPLPTRRPSNQGADHEEEEGNVDEAVESYDALFGWLANFEEGDKESGRDLRPASQLEPGGENDELSNWLARLEDGPDQETEAAEGRQEMPTATEAGEATDSESTEGLPAWLTQPGLESADESEEPGRSLTADSDAEDVSLADFEEEDFADWLADRELSSPQEASNSTDQVEDQAADDFPDWLSELDDADELGDAELEEEEFDDFPDWLAGLETSEAGESWFSGQVENAAVSGEDDTGEAIPGWLQREIDAAEMEVAETAAPPAGEESASDDKAGDWTDEGEDWGEQYPLGNVQEPNARDQEGTRADNQGSDDVEPDWLAELGEETLPGTETEEEVDPVTGLPRWLDDVPGASTKRPTEANLGEIQPEDDLAAFLAGLDEDELPNWMGDLEASPLDMARLEEMEAAPSQEKDAGVDEEEALPGWLQARLAEEGAAAEEEGSARPAEVEPGGPEAEESEKTTRRVVPEEDLPDWLGDVMFADEEADALAFDGEDFGEGAGPTFAGMGDVPSSEAFATWLDEARSAEEEVPAEPTPLEEIPDWLRRPVESDLEDVEEIFASELPQETSEVWQDVLDELPPPAQAAGSLQPADIPEWLLALQPGSSREGTESTESLDADEEGSGPLAGLRGVLEVEPVVGNLQPTIDISSYSVSPAQQQQIALLRQLTRAEAQEETQLIRPKVPAGSPYLRILLALLLLAALFTGLLAPDLLDTSPPQAASTVAAREVMTAAAGQPVLLAFDYSPAMAGVMDDQALFLLRELAANGSPVLLVSQSPAGLALGRRAVKQVGDLESYEVGYLPGDAIGLRLLADCLQTGSACTTLSGASLSAETQALLPDIGLILLLTADRTTLQNWIEHVDSTSELPFVVGLTQAMAPVAAPYLASGQLDGLLAGFPATVAYEAEGAAPDEITAAQLDALALAHWLVIGALIIGNLFYLVTGFTRSRKANAA